MPLLLVMKFVKLTRCTILKHLRCKSWFSWALKIAAAGQRTVVKSQVPRQMDATFCSWRVLDECSRRKGAWSCHVESRRLEHWSVEEGEHVNWSLFFQNEDFDWMVFCTIYLGEIRQIITFVAPLKPQACRVRLPHGLGFLSNPSARGFMLCTLPV